jgi:hypothetical protein
MVCSLSEAEGNSWPKLLTSTLGPTLGAALRSVSGPITSSSIYVALSPNNKTHVYDTKVDEASHGYVTIFPSAKTMN